MSFARDTSALVVLLRRGPRSPQAYAELVEEAGSAASVLERDGPQQGLFDPDPDLDATASEIEDGPNRGTHPVSVPNPRYHETPLAARDGPPQLFVARPLRDCHLHC